MKSGQTSDTKGLKKVNRNVLSELLIKINSFLANIKTDNITDSNKLIGALVCISQESLV